MPYKPFLTIHNFSASKPVLSAILFHTILFSIAIAFFFLSGIAEMDNREKTLISQDAKWYLEIKELGIVVLCEDIPMSKIVLVVRVKNNKALI